MKSRKLIRQKEIPNIRTINEILNYFQDRKVDHEYLKDHCKRYEFLIAQIDKIINKLSPKIKKPIRILDLGPSFQTEILRTTIPQVIVDSLGFYDSRVFIRSKDKHIEYDLNNIQYNENWLKMKKYDLIIMAELIEHLYTSPSLILGCIVAWLNKEGYLIIQTPNAISLNRRLKMILGRHPYDLIRETRLNPGHFREYTNLELVSFGEKAGLAVDYYTASNYFRHKGITGSIYNSLCNLLPKSFKDGITICFRKK